MSIHALTHQRSSKTKEKRQIAKDQCLSLTAKHGTLLTGPANLDLSHQKQFTRRPGHINTSKIDVCTLFHYALYHIYLWPEQIDTKCGFAGVNTGLNCSQPFWEPLRSSISSSTMRRMKRDCKLGTCLTKKEILLKQIFFWGSSHIHFILNQCWSCCLYSPALICLQDVVFSISSTSLFELSLYPEFSLLEKALCSLSPSLKENCQVHLILQNYFLQLQAT